MKISVPVFILLSLSACPAFAQKPTIPKMPDAVPPSYDAQVAGRAALAEYRYVLAALPSLHVSTRWQMAVQDATMQVHTTENRETLVLDQSTNRMQLVSTMGENKAVTRYICDGEELVVAHMTPGSKPGDKPERTFFRIPLENQAKTLTSALFLAKANNTPIGEVTRAALLCLPEERWIPNTSQVFQEHDNSIIERASFDILTNHVLTTVRRYRFGASHLLTQEEIWMQDTDKGKNESHTTYVLQQFTYNNAPVSAAAFSTKLALGYTETPPPSGVNPPGIPGPDRADAKARALLMKWRKAWESFSSYTAQVHVREWTQAVKKEGEQPDGSTDREARVEIQYARPGKLYIYSHPYGKKSSFLLEQTFVSNGKNLVIYEKNQKRGESALPPDDASLHDVGRNAGFWDFSEVLPRVVENPQQILDAAEQATYRGVLSLPDGGTAEAVELTLSFTDSGLRRGSNTAGPVIAQQAITLYFDSKTGLPRRSAFLMHWLSGGANQQVQAELPLDEHRVADFDNIRLNIAIPDSIFDLSRIR